MTFTVRSINLNCSAIDNAAGRTVAFVTPQGYVDWLLRSPQESGERLAAVDKETHLGSVRGLKFNWIVNLVANLVANFVGIDPPMVLGIDEVSDDVSWERKQR